MKKNAPPVGKKRTLRLRLDPAQYHADMKAADLVYDTVNLLVRRNAKENNFKGILETIRWVVVDVDDYGSCNEFLACKVGFGLIWLVCATFQKKYQYFFGDFIRFIYR